jgi:threonine dehydrogenase-like Zn-dependent dehydrogenase
VNFAAASGSTYVEAEPDAGRRRGVIEAVGDGAADLRVGQRVAAFTVNRTRNTARRRADIRCRFQSFTDGAAFRSGDDGLSHASHGGCRGPARPSLGGRRRGNRAVQLAKVRRARTRDRVDDAKQQLVKEHGADAVINYTTEKFADEVLKLTDGKGRRSHRCGGKPTFGKGHCLGTLAVILCTAAARRIASTLPRCPQSQKVSGFMVPTITRNFPGRRARARSAASR